MMECLAAKFVGGLHLEADSDGQLPKILKLMKSVVNGVRVGVTMKTN